MRYLYTINGQQFDVFIDSPGGMAAPVVAAAPATPAAVLPAFSTASLASLPAGGAGESITAAFGGRIGGVKVKVGQPVGAGELLILLDGEGGQSAIAAPRAGMVKQILVNKGASVETGDVLAVLS